LARALAAAAAARGGEVRRIANVTGFVGTGDRVTGVRTDTGVLTNLDAIVLAAGPWTKALATRLGANVPTAPMRGQMVAYQSAGLHHCVWGEDGYLVPKQNGVLFAGATVEDVGFRPRTTRKGVMQLRKMAGGLVPALRRTETASEWAGLRPGSPDGLPILGALPTRQNVYVATGHFRSGILLAPITGKLMSERIVQGSSVSLEPFSPARFANV
jgi:glycine oxidase